MNDPIQRSSWTQREALALAGVLDHLAHVIWDEYADEILAAHSPPPGQLRLPLGPRHRPCTSRLELWDRLVARQRDLW